MTFKYTFDYHDEDVFFCTADIGWVTGHSYIVYGPLSLGATSLMFEGVPNYPDAGRFWEIVEKHGVNQFYTAPTAIRALMKAGDEWPAKYDLSEPARARHGRRADQPRGVDVVLREHRPRARADRRHVVADRDRRPHDHQPRRAPRR